MTDFERGLQGIPQQAAEASAAIAAIQAPAEKAAAAIDDAFAKAGMSLVRSLSSAAADGKITLAELAQAVLSAVNAANKGGGLSNALASVFSSFSGTRADGGPVTRGGAYLVGERGPEVFRPSSAGSIEPASGAMTINVSVQGSGGPALIRSDAQIAQALARAVSLGARRL
jgi:hypothetical protein